MSEFKIINTEIANLYKNHNFKSEVISQGLIWENVKILDDYDNWNKICQWDGYISYIHKGFLINPKVYIDYSLTNDNKWYRVNDRIVKIKEVESYDCKLLSFGSIIPVIDKSNNSFITIMPDGKKYYISEKFLINYTCNNSFKDIVQYALENLGSPYFWGGKSGFGYDCSGFIQSLYRFKKIDLPRDTKDQIKSDSLKKVSSDYKPGDLIYFHKDNIVNHVGMFIDCNEYIHSSGYVKINSINKNHNSFDKTLYDNILGVYRLKNVS